MENGDSSRLEYLRERPALVLVFLDDNYSKKGRPPRRRWDDRCARIGGVLDRDFGDRSSAPSDRAGSDAHRQYTGKRGNGFGTRILGHNSLSRTRAWRDLRSLVMVRHRPQITRGRGGSS